MSRIYYVAPTGCNCNPGTIDAPFRTINHAAQLALPDDTVRVREGVYREWVDPAEGGLTPASRITYEAMPGEHVVIKGSEIVTGWTLVDGTVWTARSKSGQPIPAGAEVRIDAIEGVKVIVEPAKGGAL